MPVVEITSLNHSGVEVFASMTEAQLLRRESPLFIAESPKVISTALSAGYKPVALLCERRHITGDAAEIIAAIGGDIPVYTGDRELLSSLTGYTLTRGVLCAMERRERPTIADVVNKAKRLAVIAGVCDTTNIGAIFRSAAALGVDGVLLTKDSCDPFNRRSIRVSMGSVFLVPWTWIDEPLTSLDAFGFKTVAMALHGNSVTLDSPLLKSEPRLAIVLGTEGDGLPAAIVESADYVARIPMAHGVDSLNVAAAAAVAFWELRI